MGMRARVEAAPNKSARGPKGKKMNQGSNIDLKSTPLFLCGFARMLPLTKRYKTKSHLIFFEPAWEPSMLCRWRVRHNIASLTHWGARNHYLK